MATKVYKLNQPKNTATFQLTTNHGRMTVGYEFKGGNQTTKVPATCTLKSEFYQQILENSAIFKNGIVKIDRVLEEKKADPKKEAKTTLAVEEITSPDQAIEYVFNHWGTVVKTGKQAATIAAKKGVTFPNMKEQKPKE
jgi:hypothetical protein